MGDGQVPPTQRHYAQQQYYAQQPSPQGQQQQSQPQYQQYQQQQQYQSYQPYQPPQQPQYYSPQQQQYASPPSAPQPSPLVASPPPLLQQQQHFLAELEAPLSATPRPKPRPTSTSTSSQPNTVAAPVPDPDTETQHGIPGTGPAVFEMPAEAAAPGDAAKPPEPQMTASASSSVAATPPPPATGAEHAGQNPPFVQANPWGFFLPDDLPEGSGSTSPTKDTLAHDQMLSVKPLRIVKTGPAEERPPSGGQGGSRPQSDAVEGFAPLPLRPAPDAGAGQSGGSPDTTQLAPAPLGIARPQPPPAQHRPSAPTSPVSTAPSASQLPYPLYGSSIPTPDSHPMPQPGAQITVPLHPRPTGSLSDPASPTILAPSPLTPSQTVVAVPQPQPQHHQAPPQHAYTQASPMSPIIVQAGLPPTLPVGSYFPQQPSYAPPEAVPSAAAPPEAQHSPAPSVSSTTQAALPAGQHSPAQPYASPPPSYTYAVTQGQPATTSPTSLAQYDHQPAPVHPLSPNPTGVPLPMSPPPSQYPYSPSCIGAAKPGSHHQPPPIPQQTPYSPHAAPPIPQPSYVNGPQHCQPIPPPLPPRTSPPTPGQYGYGAPSPYGPPPTRPNYHAPPPKSDSRLFSSATARKLLNKTTELVDQTITPYLQDHRYRPPYNGYQYQNQNQNQNQYQYQYQYQYPNRPPSGPQGQYHQQGYAPSQPTYAAPQAARENPDRSRTS